MPDLYVDWFLVYVIIAGYFVSRISERTLRWKVYGFAQIVGMGIWLLQFVLLQIYGSLW